MKKAENEQLAFYFLVTVICGCTDVQLYIYTLTPNK